MRSLDSVAALAINLPAAHGKLTFTHASLPAVGLKVPAAHAVHVRSLDSVAALFVYSPATHGKLTFAHAKPLSALEYVTLSTHGRHSRSAVSEPAADSPLPTAHFLQASHGNPPVAFLNLPKLHAVHSAFDDAVADTFSYSPASQIAMALHARSEVAVASVDI